MLRLVLFANYPKSIPFGCQFCYCTLFLLINLLKILSTLIKSHFKHICSYVLYSYFKGRFKGEKKPWALHKGKVPNHSPIGSSSTFYLQGLINSLRCTDGPWSIHLENLHASGKNKMQIIVNNRRNLKHES